MRFPLIVFKDENSSYSGVLPDFAGCYPSGDTLDELFGNVQDAVETWMLGEDPSIFPKPTSLEDAYKLEAAHGRTLLLVDVDTSFMDTATQRVNITVPRYALGLIDKAAKAHGMARSAFMVESSLERIQHHA